MITPAAFANKTAPAASFTPSSFDSQMRSSLRDDAVWGEIIAGPNGQNRAKRWLRITNANINQQLSFRSAQVEILRLSPEENKAEIISYYQWRKSATFMRSLCEKRMIELNMLRDALQQQIDTMRETLLQLAGKIAEQEGRGTIDPELYRELDEITLPGDDGEDDTALTLREYLLSQPETADAAEADRAGDARA